ncbi:MAG: GIY-YIG nuclease family protein [Burkholderiales bacterium]|jgi:TPR repeat protein|nr:GIY-YIG nuclease family protein [Burkholderiales bacterium]
MKGWIYVIADEAKPGMVKIGISVKVPELRAKELDDTASPLPHKVEYAALVDDHAKIEKKAHTHFKSAGKHIGKEWFRCSAGEAVAVIKSIVGLNVYYEENKEGRHREEINSPMALGAQAIGTPAPVEQQNETSQEAIARLAALSLLEYGQVRRKEAERLGISVGFLDKAIEDFRRTPRKESGKANTDSLLRDILATMAPGTVAVGRAATTTKDGDPLMAPTTVLKLPSAGAQVKVRFEVDKNRAYILRSALREWCKHNGMSMNEVIRALQKTGSLVAEQRRTILGRGVKELASLTIGQSDCILVVAPKGLAEALVPQLGNEEEKNEGGALTQVGLGTNPNVTKNYAEMVKRHRKAAEQGDTDARFNLGWMCANDRSVVKDDAEAAKEWAGKSVAAPMIAGSITPASSVIARTLISPLPTITQAAVDQQNERDIMGLPWDARIHSDTKNKNADGTWRMKRNSDKTVVAQVKAELLASRPPQAASSTAPIASAVPTVQGDAETLEQLRKTAGQGNARAQFHLGMMCRESKNHVAAVTWCRKAAEQGYAPAQVILGVMYVQGQGVGKNTNEGVRWFRKAAEQGDAVAVKQLRKAAGQGHESAKVALRKIGY